MKNNIEINEENKNQIATQYTPLVHKIAKQFISNRTYEYEDLVSEGYIGLMYAVDKYDDLASNNFTKYAAYMIRFHILNFINSGKMSLIRVSATVNRRLNKINQQKPIVVFAPKDEDTNSNKGNAFENALSSISMYDGEKDIQNYSDSVNESTLWAELFRMLEHNFSNKDITIFYKKFGIAGYDVTPGVDIAKEFNITSVSVSNICSRVVKFIKKDKDMLDILRNILNIYE